jgi:hypothetical protein
MILIVRIFFLLGLAVSFLCFALFFLGRGEAYKHLGLKCLLGTLILTVGFFLIAMVQSVFLETPGIIL